ncbi:hypothetical protein FQV39_04475 [Bosea sp. F3-2]|uniref:hypothetical protein n=1 Tax=Bosea sp. F3-2 TaxID=2599640 RepID=UPI0011EFA26B|nr:hypothetical protein [Bosea sp. F3-2]QEL21917.1 hypothetical protein FQV39_04475 [Bosea sp. F3-2]
MTASNAFVDFLRTYGPSASSKALYDEHVYQSSTEHGVDPIHVDRPLVGELITNFQGLDPRNIILTGTAGDGKTWHSRQVFTALGGTIAEWNAGEGIVEFPLPSGHRLVIIKDLSQFHEDPRQEGILSEMLQAILKSSSDSVFLLCANDGQLLRFFRTYVSKHPDASTVEEKLRTMLKEDGKPDPSLHLTMHNLSRRPQDELFDQLVDAVANHPGWKDCVTCPSSYAERDPIRRNLHILAKTSMRDRLRDLIRIAAANDTHLPMRHLLLLIVNIILGVSGKKTALMDCKLSGHLADQDETHLSNPYDNALGLNLKLDGNRDYLAFTVFQNFGIGQETNNAIDSLLIDGAPSDLYQRFVGSDELHGSKRFEAIRQEYRKGEADSFQRFQEALEAQRRRLFFVLPNDPKFGEMDPWRLSVFMHGGAYVEFCDALKNGQRTDKTIGRLVIGLNRSYSGAMCDDHDRVWFTAPAANTQSRIGRVLDIDLPLGDAPRDTITVNFDAKGSFNRPQIVVLMREKIGGPSHPIESNPLQPLLFEYLLRVQGGSLPGSFSRQCFEELRQFRLRVVAKLSHLKLIELDDLTQMSIVKLGTEGRLQRDSIGVTGAI